MNLPWLFSMYLTGNILIVSGLMLILAVDTALWMARLVLKPTLKLKLNYFILSMVFVFILAPFNTLVSSFPPGLAPLSVLPSKSLFRPIITVWAAPRGDGAGAAADNVENGIEGMGSGTISVSKSSRMFDFGKRREATLEVLILLALALVAFRIMADLRRLVRIRSRCHLLRHVGHVRVWVSAEIRVAFSFWFPGQSHVFVPEKFLGKPEFRIAILHEIQHHRQRDTKWVYVILGLRWIFFINPLIHLWSRSLSEVQELACDDTLVGRRKVEKHAYARCLVQVAQSLVEFEGQPIRAMGRVFLFNHKTLKRRITSMLQETNDRPVVGRWGVCGIGLALAVIIGVTAYASRGLVVDRRISLSRARALASATTTEFDFPVVVNERVLRWLNDYVGTPDGREHVKAALARMENYRGPIEARLAHYGLPSELMAVPLIESGFQNLEARRNPLGAAGLWHFISSTANNFGLKVNGGGDDRLDVDLSSDAALRLLLSDKLRFNDWQLSLLAYNAGERAVQEAIDHTGSRDAWVLMDSGLLSKESTEYVPKLMAGILVMRNSTVLL